jgi:uncharacterized protein YuzE
MRTTYSPAADALAVWLGPAGVTSVATKEIGRDVYADFDAEGRFVGIEVLNAGELLNQAELEQLPRPSKD